GGAAFFLPLPPETTKNGRAGARRRRRGEEDGRGPLPGPRLLGAPGRRAPRQLVLRLRAGLPRRRLWARRPGQPRGPRRAHARAAPSSSPSGAEGRPGGDAPRLLAIRREAGGGNCTRAPSHAEGCDLLDLSVYAHVRIDEGKRTATVGARVTMEDLSAACLRQGVLPLVVPEFRRITVGGAVVGAGVESSSGRFGEFSEGCVSCRVRLGSGEVLTCSDAEHPDLFRALSGSYGSLATVLEVELRLQEAKPYVKLQYRWFDDLSEACRFLASVATTSIFAEGLSYPMDKGYRGLPDVTKRHVVIVADWADEAGDPHADRSTMSITESHDLWFYEHVFNTRNSEADHTDVLKTESYLHRHERGAFWMARPEGDSSIPLSPAGLLLWILSGPLRKQFDDYFKTPHLFQLLKLAPQAIIADNFLNTDIYTDVELVETLVHEVRGSSRFALRTPMRGTSMKAQPFSPNGNWSSPAAPRGKVLIDVGLYGRVRGGAGVDAARFFEAWGLANNSRKMLSRGAAARTRPGDGGDFGSRGPGGGYSQNYYSASDFWRPPVMFCPRAYRQLRQKYKAEGRLVDLYDKVGDSTSTVAVSRQGAKYWAWWLLTKLV
ncbi:unnamed protein product, partial [Prorocentrum cordatum]